MPPEHMACIFITTYFAAYWLLAWLYPADQRDGTYFIRAHNVLLHMGPSRAMLAFAAVMVILLWKSVP